MMVRNKFILVIIFLFAVINRLVYLYGYLNKDPLSKTLILDSHRYDLWAQTIAKGGLFESGAFYQAPVYPYFLSLIYGLTGRSFTSVYIIQMVIGLASILFLFLLAKKYFSERTALISAFLFSFYGTTIFFESKFLPETIAIFVNLFFLLALAYCDHKKMKGQKLSKALLLWMSGILLGLSCLIRPNMLLLLPLILLWVLFSKTPREADEKASEPEKVPRRLMNASILLMGSLLIILPITMRNYLESGNFVPVSLNGGITFAQGNNPYAKGIYTPLPGFSGEIFHQRQEERYYAQAEEGRELSDAEVSTFWFRKGWSFIKENPSRWLTLELKKLFYFFDNYEHSLEYSYPVERQYLNILSILPFGLIISLALLGLLASFPWKDKGPLLLYLLVQVVTVLIFYMSSRYRLPAVPILCLFSGYGVSFLIDLYKKKTLLKILLSLMCVVIVSVVSFIKIGDVYDLEEASTYGNLGTAFNASGLLQDALSSFEKQIELDPESAYALFNIGVVLSKMGKEGEAVSYYERAIKLNPSLTEAYNNLGVILVKWGDCSSAEVLFLKALNIKPFLLNPYINLLSCYLMRGDIEKVMRIKNMAVRNGVEIPQQLEREIQDRIIEQNFQ
jgi:4-amino-4-deoxy-L-arabinose transferase-like glycosyltransferase